MLTSIAALLVLIVLVIYRFEFEQINSNNSIVNCQRAEKKIEKRFDTVKWRVKNCQQIKTKTKKAQVKRHGQVEKNKSLYRMQIKPRNNIVQQFFFLCMYFYSLSIIGFLLFLLWYFFFFRRYATVKTYLFVMLIVSFCFRLVKTTTAITFSLANEYRHRKKWIAIKWSSTSQSRKKGSLCYCFRRWLSKKFML